MVNRKNKMIADVYLENYLRKMHKVNEIKREKAEAQEYES